MSSRQAIFDRLRGREVEDVTLPSHEGPWITFADRGAQFQQMVQFVGGTCHRCQNEQEVASFVTQRMQAIQPKQIVSLLPHLATPTLDLAKIEDAHELEAVDLVVAEAELGVAENGALWFTDAQIKHRTVLFITQHLLIIVKTKNLVDHMHAAYQQVAVHGRNSDCFYQALPRQRTLNNR